MASLRQGFPAILSTLLCAAALAAAQPCSCMSLPVEKKVALVIGNSNYDAEPTISGVEDARAMADALSQIGFTVLPKVLDASLADTNTALDKFSQQLSGASVVLLYFSGHGYQRLSKTYLMPKNGTTDPASSLLVDDVLQYFSAAPGAAVKLLLIDACRNELRLPPGAPLGPADPGTSPPGVLQVFATSPGSEATGSGSATGHSAFTTALLHHIRKAGLEIDEILALTAAELKGVQTPFEAFPSAGIPRPFYLRQPVFAQAAVEAADDDLVVLLNGKIVLDKAALGKGDQPLRLNAGTNQLALLVANQKTFHNSQSWERTEGWDYIFRLFGPGGLELTSPSCGGKSPCFKDGEPVPFKDGPHHGHVFEVAQAVLVVDPDTAELTLQNVDTDIWNRDVPFYARQQECLFEEKAKDLPVGDALGLGPGVDFARTLDQVFQALKLLGATKLPDLDKVFVTVRGNAALTPFVKVCMVDKLPDRKADLKTSLAAAKAGNPTPFDSFDASLSACVKDAATKSPGPLSGQEIRVWTALEDRTDDKQPSKEKPCGEFFASRRP